MAGRKKTVATKVDERGKEIIKALQSFEEAKGLGVDVVCNALEEALVNAYQKSVSDESVFGSDERALARASVNPVTGEIKLFNQKRVVEEVFALLGEPIPKEIERKFLIEMPDLEEAIDKVMAGPEKKSRIISDEEKENKQEDAKMAEAENKKSTEKEKTVQDVVDSMTEEQKTVMYALIGQAIEEAEGANNDKDSEGGSEMKQNVFEGDAAQGNVLSHSDQESIIELAKRSNVGSLQMAIDTYAEQNNLSLKHGFVDEEGNAEGIDKAFLGDAISGIIGAILGTSTLTAYVESATGIGLGGRTGLTAVFTGIFFLLALIFAPTVLALFTSSVTAAALVIVGILMIVQLKEVDWDNMVVAASVFMTIIMMLLTYSISLGIAWGFVTYAIASIATGKAKEFSWIMWIMVIIFALYVFFGL